MRKHYFLRDVAMRTDSLHHACGTPSFKSQPVATFVSLQKGNGHEVKVLKG